MPVRCSPSLLRPDLRLHDPAVPHLRAPHAALTWIEAIMITSRDVDQLHSAAVRTLDGSIIGHVSDVYVDDDDQPLLLGVRRGRLSVNQMLVPVDGAILLGRELLIAASDAAVAAAPSIVGLHVEDDDLIDQAVAHWAMQQLPQSTAPAALQVVQTARSPR